MYRAKETVWVIFCLLIPAALFAQSRHECSAFQDATLCPASGDERSSTVRRTVDPRVPTLVDGQPGGAVFEVPWLSSDGGGGSACESEVFRITGTIGQFEAAELAGERTRFVGGFWAGMQSPRLQAAIFADGFESGDDSAWD